MKVERVQVTKTAIEAITGFFSPLKWKWSEFTWNYWYMPKYRLQLFKRLWKVDYCNFDISFSLVEYIFEMYKHYFETCEDRLKPWVDDNGKTGEIKFFSMGEEDKPSGMKYQEFRDIYDYIVTYRVENEKKTRELQDYIFQPFKIDWIPTKDKELLEMKTIVDIRQINVKWTYDDLGRLTLITKEVKKANHSYFELEVLSMRKDLEFAKKIFEIHEYLWV